MGRVKQHFTNGPQLVGGAINLAKNHEKGASGGVTPDTYIAFLIIESLALPFAFLISPLENVVRSDGTRILVSEGIGTKQEIKKIRVTMTSKLILLSALWAFWSFFYRQAAPRISLARSTDLQITAAHGQLTLQAVSPSARARSHH